MFNSYNITDDTSKYLAVIMVLDSETVEQLSDILGKPPDTGRYANLKQEIISRFADSSDRQLHKALSEIQLGGKKPSQLLRQMTTLAGERIAEDVLRIR